VHERFRVDLRREPWHSPSPAIRCHVRAAAALDQRPIAVSRPRCPRRRVVRRDQAQECSKRNVAWPVQAELPIPFGLTLSACGAEEDTTDQPFGPFSVAPGQISALGTGFTPFVNELLRIESSAAKLDGGQLTTTYLDNVGDEGVDAGLRRAAGTKYIPPGDSAWQFKAGDLTPSKCKQELRGPQGHGESAALNVVRAGGKYRLVLGADLTDAKVRRRREALEEEATTLGIDLQPGMFEVLNASDLAAWAQEHPALAVSPLLHGITNVAHNFAQWSASNRLTSPWVDAPSRDTLTRAIREFVMTGAVDLHVEGVSGVGKTRAVLEAIRGQDFEPLVAYVYAADALPASLIHQLQTQVRHTILVVAECPFTGRGGQGCVAP
jgi:hypothetical protein